MKRYKHLASLAVATLAFTLTPGVSNAAPGAPEGTTEIKISGAELAELRENQNLEDSLPKDEHQALVEELVDDAAEDGNYLDAESVDMIEVLDGALQVAVPVDTEIENITITRDYDSEELSIESTGTGIADEAATASGPQMAAAWVNDGGPWTYKLYFYVSGQRAADGIFNARRWIKNNTTGKNVVRYDRWASSQSYSLNNLPDASLTALRIQNFPYDSVEPHLGDWIRFSPGATLNSGTGCSSYTVGWTLGSGIGASRTFDKCDKIVIWRNIDKASSYWAEWQGSTKQNREVAYTLAWYQTRGSARSQHDTQKMSFSFPAWALLPNTSCTQTDAGRTCNFA